MPLDKQLLERIKNNDTTLTSINLYDNKIGAAGAKDLSAALAKNTTLTSINLYDNKIGAVGAKDLSAALAKNTTLTSIILNNNNIGDAGAKDLSAALTKNTTLTSIYLSSNDIGAAGAKDLSAALAKNTTLTWIDLWNNKIGAAGAKDLSAALAKNTTLTSIDLTYNNIGAAGAKELSAALAKNTTLTSIILKDNKIGAALEQEIKGYLARNQQLAAELLTAVKNNELNKAAALLTQYVRPMAKDDKNNTALHWAVMKTNIPMITLLLKYRADITAQNNENKTPLALAKAQNNPQVLALLGNKTSAAITATSTQENKVNAGSSAALTSKESSSASNVETQAPVQLETLLVFDSHNQQRSYQQLNETIQALTQKLAALPASDGVGNVIHTQAEKQQLLAALAEQQEKATQLAEETYLSKDSHVRDYYVTVQVQFSSIYQAAKSIYSEMVANESKGKLSTLADIVEKLTQLVTLPVVSAGMNIVAGLLKKIDARTQKDKINHIVSLAPTQTKADAIIEMLARKLALAKMSAIQEKAKKDENKKAIAKLVKLVDYVTANPNDSAAKKLATADVESMIKVLLEGKLSKTGDSVDALLITVLGKGYKIPAVTNPDRGITSAKQNQSVTAVEKEPMSSTAKVIVNLVSQANSAIPIHQQNASPTPTQKEAASVEDVNVLKQQLEEMKAEREKEKQQTENMRQMLEKLSKKIGQDNSNEMDTGTQAMLSANAQANPKQAQQQQQDKLLYQHDKQIGDHAIKLATVMEHLGLKDEVTKEDPDVSDDQRNQLLGRSSIL